MKTVNFCADSRLAVVINNLGIVLIQLDDYESAEKHLRRALSIAQNKTFIYWIKFNLAMLLYKIKGKYFLEFAREHEKEFKETRDENGSRYFEIKGSNELELSKILEQKQKITEEKDQLFREVFNMDGTCISPVGFSFKFISLSNSLIEL